MSDDEKKVSYYEWVKAHDVLGWTQPFWEQGGWVLREDGKLCFDKQTMAINTPWRHIKQAWELDCATWHRLIFDLISRNQPPNEKFVPSKCHQCFKIVVRPHNLKQLFALENLQIRMDKPSKCGIEVRATVHGLYGGYFYTIGLEAGLARYKEVRAAVDEDKYLGPDVPVILKRGCTEFELEVGPSDEWKVTEAQLIIESLIDRWVVKDDAIRKQPEILIWFIHKRWIEYAYTNGDATYLEFTDGRPLFPPYRAYHHLADQPLDPSASKEVVQKTEGRKDGKHKSKVA